jgi:hypothetical protein
MRLRRAGVGERARRSEALGTASLASHLPKLKLCERLCGDAKCDTRKTWVHSLGVERHRSQCGPTSSNASLGTQMGRWVQLILIAGNAFGLQDRWPHQNFPFWVQVGILYPSSVQNRPLADTAVFDHIGKHRSETSTKLSRRGLNNFGTEGWGFESLRAYWIGFLRCDVSRAREGYFSSTVAISSLGFSLRIRPRNWTSCAVPGLL